MSLAFNAAIFDNENDNNIIQRKKNTAAHRRTQKRYPEVNNDKVNSVLQSIHNNSEEGGNDLGDYYENPPPKAASVGVMRSEGKEGMQNNSEVLKSLGLQPQPNQKSDFELYDFQQNYGTEESNVDYYKKFIPNFSGEQLQQQQQQQQNQRYRQPQAASPMPSYGSSNDLLMQKLNYVIHLLEEKQDERTNHVTEEVVLYSFLGVFIIFIVDGFTRVGKYTR